MQGMLTRDKSGENIEGKKPAADITAPKKSKISTHQCTVTFKEFVKYRTVMRPIQTLPLPGNVISKLLTGGFLFCEDVFEEDGKKIKLEARERLNNLPAEVVRKLESIQECPKMITALDLYNEEIKSEQIVTFSQSVDKLLDGGITLGEVTELSGASGSGKTQLCNIAICERDSAICFVKR
ncbi:DNA repair protein RAD51 homolog 1-like [Nilaparvata lugens]|uniref:DNA repair protein RAD51 homolog 1-like n=1 Tax=Nilaparvata lugens TaxID=108931 RepID=UPI00193E8833|nr:DNA repair protein RAD51 homolog 1-like [Nilaparvata lugens]